MVEIKRSYETKEGIVKELSIPQISLTAKAIKKEKEIVCKLISDITPDKFNKFGGYSFIGILDIESKKAESYAFKLSEKLAQKLLKEGVKKFSIVKFIYSTYETKTGADQPYLEFIVADEHGNFDEEDESEVTYKPTEQEQKIIDNILSGHIKKDSDVSGKKAIEYLSKEARKLYNW